MSDEELARILARLDASPIDPEGWERLVDFRARRGQRDLGVYQVRDLLARVEEPPEEAVQAFYALASQRGFGLGDPFRQYPARVATILQGEEIVVVAEGLGVHWLNRDDRSRMLLETRAEVQVVTLRVDPLRLALVGMEEGALKVAILEGDAPPATGWVPWRELELGPGAPALHRAWCLAGEGAVVLVTAEGRRVGLVPVEGGPPGWVEIPAGEIELRGISVHPGGHAAVVRALEDRSGGSTYWLVEPGREPERLDQVPPGAAVEVTWTEGELWLQWP
jgi:hypothetical protein